MALNWSELTDDLLTLITDKLKFIKDYVRFGATCLNWHSVFSKNGDRLPPQPPLLMITTERPHDNLITHSFYSVFDRRFYNSQVSMPHKRHCCGSGFGWVFTVEETSLEVHLVNPFSSINNKIRLPSLDSLGSSFIIGGGSSTVLTSPIQIHKVVLSANPSSTPDYVVVIIYGGFSMLAFFKAGGKIWSRLGFQWNGFKDVIYCKGKFYAIQFFGIEVVVCDFSYFHPKLTTILVAPSSWPLKHRPMRPYLAELSGNLLLVIKEHDYTVSTFGFQVFKLEPIELRWVKVTSLDNFTLFLGGNSSMFVLASDFPGCKPNCIHFTGDFGASFLYPAQLRYLDSGVFNLEEGRIESYYPTSAIIKRPPIWVEPVLQGCK